MSKLRTHYDNLKVTRDAPDFVIRAAYKTLSQKYHPDKHPGDERAGRVMAIINGSYEILSDPERRASHDAWIAREELRLARQASQQNAGAPIPPQWQQPAPVVPAPPPRSNMLAALLLWPLKLLLSLFRAAPMLVLFGLVVGGFLLWDAVIPDRPPPPGPKPYQAQAPIKQAPDVGISNCRTVPYSYKKIDGKDSQELVYTYIRDGARHYSSKKPPGCDVDAKAESTPRTDNTPEYVHPLTAPNGNPWPTVAAYVKGYPVDNDNGYSKVTVDNGQNDSDVFVKLVSLDGDDAYPVRQFFIPAHSRFTMNKVTAGNYDIRYRDLGNGGLSRSEAFDVEEIRTADGVQFSNLTMTLYKVQDGNFQTYDLADSEF